MEIKFRGDMSLAEVRQALYEKLHEIEDDYAIRFSRGATLFINPTNEFGEQVTPRGQSGEEVKKLQSLGPYRSAADEFKM